jgi:hypothetical protein
VQVDPIKSKFKAPGTKRLKLKYDERLSSFAFNFNLRRYSTGLGGMSDLRREARWMRLMGEAHVELGRVVQVDPIKPKLKPPRITRLKLKYDVPLSNFAFKFKLHPFSSASSARPATTLSGCCCCCRRPR